MPTSWQWWFDVCFYAIRDYGMLMVDTAGGGGWAIRMEPTAQTMVPAANCQFIQYLFQSCQDELTQLQLIQPGTDGAFYS